MHQASIIDDNRAVLIRIVTALIAMAGLSDGNMARISRELHRAVWRVLYPAESAVRRLIVFAARGLTVKLSPVRPMPKGLALGRAGNGRLSFQLFDKRKHFLSAPRRIAAGAVPRVHVFGVSPLVPLFQPRPVASSVPEPDDGAGGDVPAQHLGRRLAAIKMALENLPQQARRLVRWQARRSRTQRPTFKSPLRPGPPPGYRKESEDEIDRVLRTCHALARQALDEDTS